MTDARSAARVRHYLGRWTLGPDGLLHLRLGRQSAGRAEHGRTQPSSVAGRRVPGGASRRHPLARECMAPGAAASAMGPGDGIFLLAAETEAHDLVVFVTCPTLRGRQRSRRRRRRKVPRNRPPAHRDECGPGADGPAQRCPPSRAVIPQSVPAGAAQSRLLAVSEPDRLTGQPAEARGCCQYRVCLPTEPRASTPCGR